MPGCAAMPGCAVTGASGGAAAAICGGGSAGAGCEYTGGTIGGENVEP